MATSHMKARSLHRDISGLTFCGSRLSFSLILEAPIAGEQNLGAAHEYLRDAWQRSILFFDVLRQRGNIYREQQEKIAPNVLEFGTELVLDGRELSRPVNYLLVRIMPPEGMQTDPAKRPFVVVDPRAGHGPGIGGMKQDSEIGVALENGHPCYFIGFLPEPVAGQTIEDVWNAEAGFVAEVARRHPDAGKPAVIGNCQAGWQTMIMAATHPDVPGPLLLAGAPLSYWAGERGKNPMRYAGGMLGGTWLTSLSGELGGGKFDGANLVSNFESLDPANTYFEKPYNVYSKVDTEAERFLDFETWWGSPVLMNAAEMQWIADNLFVGNKLTSGDIQTSDGLQIDLRNIKSPIVVFCSWGDNITPPQQALGWITDIYCNDDDLVGSGQTIIYSIHETVGHLGIFVSGKIATREHDEFASAMDMIDMMPPGLFEALIEEVGEGTANRNLIEGDYLFKLVPRTLDDIRKLGGNNPQDDREFAAVQRVSTINRRLYETYLSPVVRSVTPPGFGEWARKMHPNRVRFAIFSDENPAMGMVAQSAQRIRTTRQPVGEGNVFAKAEETLAGSISATLSAFGAARDAMTEQLFHMNYGSAVLQALVGLDPKGADDDRAPHREVLREQAKGRNREALEQRFGVGGAAEAALRSLAYILKGDGSVDERGYAMLKQLHDDQPPGKKRSMAQLKATLREQSLLLRIDEERAVAAIFKLLPRGASARALTLGAVERVVSAQGNASAEGRRRLARIRKLFAVRGKPEVKKGANATH
jgi:pimeloyl-ACP methyl ester carboxylesterase